MIGVIDQGRVGALMLLDLSAAFDTVDHCVLVEMMKARFGVEGNALGWVADFLSNRSQSIRSRNVKSEESALHFGVPQDRCSVPEFSISMPRTSQNYSTNITYAIICSPKICSATAAEDLLKLL